MGEYWDYVIRPSTSELRLRATAPPANVFEIDERVWLEIDPTRISKIPPPAG
jgi:hypothetical protein